MSYLEAVREHKRREVTRRKAAVLRAALESRPLFGEPRRGLLTRLRRRAPTFLGDPGSRLRAEGDVEWVRLLRRFSHAGSSALVIPTDSHFLGGDSTLLERARRCVDLPLLQRDYILDPYQIYEARAWGADGILLMPAMLDPMALLEMREVASELDLDCVVVVGREADLDALDPGLVSAMCIDNRDPDTFEPDMMSSVRLRKRLPRDTVVLSEGGILSLSDVRFLWERGIAAVMAGTELLGRLEAEGPQEGSAHGAAS
ncbi:MAG: hypothetical protein WB626_00565 [Bacteroidota bacterium]